MLQGQVLELDCGFLKTPTPTPPVFPQRWGYGGWWSLLRLSALSVRGSPSLPRGTGVPFSGWVSSSHPAPNTETEPLLTWKKAQDMVPWNIILLLGGGFAMAKGCEVRSAGGPQARGGVHEPQSQLQAQGLSGQTQTLQAPPGPSSARWR